MNKFILIILLSLFTLSSKSQEYKSLPSDNPNKIEWQTPEKEYYSNIWDTEIVSNVSKPGLLIYKPSAEKNNGAAVIVAPGGALYALSITSEGTDVAKWLVEKGFTVFVLKYRLVPTQDDAPAELSQLEQENPEKFRTQVEKVLPLSIQDGLEAVKYVRESAGSYGIDPQKIGFMGFSAGGAVCLGVAYNYKAESKPNFLAPIYPWTTAMPVQKAPADAPKMFIACATNDGLGLTKGSIELYNSWYSRGFSVEMHMYSQGDHGFGMRKKGLASDKWIARFYEWAITEKIISDKE